MRLQQPRFGLKLIAMNFMLVFAIVATIWVGTFMQTARAEQATGATGTSTWSGIYTEDQAKSGATAYAKHCSECHLEDMAGDGFAPPLRGPEFMNNWNSLTVGDLFERIRISMPPDNPNAVSGEEKARIVAHILQSAGFPAGKTELASSTEQLKSIKFEATKPGSW
jgi:S-disulfanyl-L-cysteine oxidoreductase SoxD